MDIAHIIPEPGEGPRCPKCVHKLPQQEDHCPRCGLRLVDETDRDTFTIMRWEKVDASKQRQWHELNDQWIRLEKHWNKDNAMAFVKQVEAYDLLEMGMRRFRIRLAQEPHDPVARQGLERLYRVIQPRLVIARGSAEAQAEQFVHNLARFRKWATIALAILLTPLFIWLLVSQLGGCGMSTIPVY